MNTVNTVNAWLQMAPNMIALIGAIEQLFPKKSGPAKLETFQTVTAAAVAAHVQGPVDHSVLAQLNAGFAADHVAEQNANGTFQKSK